MKTNSKKLIGHKGNGIAPDSLSDYKVTKLNRDHSILRNVATMKIIN